MAEDVTFEILHRVADAFARRDVDGIVNSFAEDGEFRNAKGPDYWGQSFKGKAAIRSYFEPLFAAASDVKWNHTNEFICGNGRSRSGIASPPCGPANARNGWAAISTPSAAA